MEATAIDPLTAAGALATGIRIFKDLIDLAGKPRQAGDLEKKLGEANLAYLAVVNRLTELEAENRSLQEQAASTDGMEFKDNVWWLSGQEGPLKGPYCPKCLQGNRRRTLMAHNTYSNWCHCSVCAHVESTPKHYAAMRAPLLREPDGRDPVTGY